MGTFNLPPLDGVSPPEKEITDKREEVVTDGPSFSTLEGIVVDKEISGTLTTFKLDTDEGIVYLLKTGADDGTVLIGSIIEAEINEATKTLVEPGEYSYKADNFDILYTPKEEVSPKEMEEVLSDDMPIEEPILKQSPTPKMPKLKKKELPEEPEDAPSDSDSQPKKEKKDGRYSFMESIKAALAEVKAELADGKSGGNLDEDLDDEDDEYEEEPEEEPKPKKRGKSKGKRKNPLKGLVNLYKKIAMFLFNLFMKPIDFLSHVPVIGRVFKLLKKLDFILKWICYFWLPILFLIVGPVFSLPSMPSKQDTKPNKVETKNVVAEKDDTSIEVIKVTEGKNPTITIKNHSKLYSNFYGEVTFEKPSFFGKKVKCETPITLMGIEEEKTLKLKCKGELKTSKVKSFDIITEYNN